MTELVLGWARATWGREALRRRLDRLEDLLSKATKLLRAYQETNRVQAETVTRLEAENAQLLTAVKAFEQEANRIDPNAKCPNCGDRNGFLTHAKTVDPKTKAVIDVLPVNNCKTCGVQFHSGEPVAGRELASQLVYAGSAGTLGEGP